MANRAWLLARRPVTLHIAAGAAVVAAALSALGAWRDVSLQRSRASSIEALEATKPSLTSAELAAFDAHQEALYRSAVLLVVATGLWLLIGLLVWWERRGMRSVATVLCVLVLALVIMAETVGSDLVWIVLTILVLALLWMRSMRLWTDGNRGQT